MSDLTGVFPVHNNRFFISTNGRQADIDDCVFVSIKDLETFKLAVEGKAEEWSPMDTGGWARQAITGKKLAVSFTGKRNYGDPGNDYVAGKLLGTGKSVESVFKWVFPTGAALLFDCVINLTSPAGGDSTALDALEFDVLSDGLPWLDTGSTAPVFDFTLTSAAVDGEYYTTSIAVVGDASGADSLLCKMDFGLTDPVVGSDAPVDYDAFVSGEQAAMAIAGMKFVVVAIVDSKVAYAVNTTVVAVAAPTELVITDGDTDGCTKVQINGSSSSNMFYKTAAEVILPAVGSTYEGGWAEMIYVTGPEAAADPTANNYPAVNGDDFAVLDVDIDTSEVKQALIGTAVVE